MVVFTCNNCGETLQKPRVAKHYQFQCRNNVFLTCVDCFKDFRGEEYVTHTKCITEAERYGGKNYVPKASANKGERKQQEWINIVNNILSSDKNLSNAEQNFLNTLSKYENIPRKKAKFLNFVRNALGNRINMQLVENVWNKMETAYRNNTQDSLQENKQENGNIKVVNNYDEVNKSDSNAEQHQENNIAENQNNENVCRENGNEKQIKSDNPSNEDTKPNKTSKQKKSKKRKISEILETAENKEEQIVRKKSEDISVLETPIDSSDKAADVTNFHWKNTILNIVETKQEISLKKLQKKVISQYLLHSGDTTTSEKASAKFHKKLKKMSEIVIAEEKVTLA